MVYRFQLGRSPKSLLIPAVAAAIMIAAVSVIVFYQPLPGIIALAVAGYLSYHLVKYFVYTLKSHVRTNDDGMVCMTATGSESRLEWDDLTHAGWYTAHTGYRELFVYAEEKDQLLTIPVQYDRMEDLEREIVEHSGVELLTFSGEDVDGLAEVLRHHIAPEGEIIDEEQESGVGDG
jgi:hypothetical protein